MLPRPLARFKKGPNSKGKEGRKREGRDMEKGEVR